MASFLPTDFLLGIISEVAVLVVGSTSMWIPFRAMVLFPPMVAQGALLWETGGGGGGRIAIWSNTYAFTGTLTASGGSGQNGGGDGEEGTACDIDIPSIETISFDACISELCTSAISVDATDPCEGSLTYEWEALDGGRYYRGRRRG